MLKKIATLLFLTVVVIFSGCFKEKSEDKGSGITIIRDGTRVKVLVKNEIIGGKFIINREISEDNIIVEADKMKIVKKLKGNTIVSIVDIDKPSKEGDKIFEIRNCLESIKIEMEEGINEKNFSKAMKKAFNTADKKGMKRGEIDFLLGDFNSDKIVDIFDFKLFKDNYGSAIVNYDIAPATMGTGLYENIYSKSTPDGSVGLLDFLIFGRNYGKTILEHAKISEIILSGEKKIEVGNSIDIYAKVKYSDNSIKSEVVDWSSSDETIATQNANGDWTRVMGIKTGKITLKASKNGKVGEVEIEVIPAGIATVESLEVTGENSVIVGNEITLTATTTFSNNTTSTTGAIWTSSVPSVAKVDGTGKITGLTAGITKIKAVRSGVSHEVTVIVAATLNGIKVHAKGYKTIYAWEGTNTLLTGAWPGATLTTTGEEGWSSYYIEGKNEVNIILIDVNGNKTGDLKGIKKGEYWYNNGKLYSYNPEQDFEAPLITASPSAGSYEQLALEVVLTAKDEKDTTPKVYYTIDGTVPTIKSSLFNEKLILTKDTEVKAIAVDKSLNVSKVYVFVYKLNQDITPPIITATVLPGRYLTAQTLKLLITDEKDKEPKLYYTVNGSEPKAELSYLYNGQSINVNQATTIRALSVDKTGNKKYYNFRYYIGEIKKSAREDFREETVYFLMTTRFYDGDLSNTRKSPSYESSGNSKYNDPSWRGDFKGLIEKLDYIKALGFTAVWITPPVLNRNYYDYHGYHSWDMTKIDGRLESPGATYQDLINEIHSRDMKIIQDIVLNHSGRYGLKGKSEIKYWGDRDDPQWGKDSKINYYDEYNPNFEYDGVSIEPKSGKSWYNGDLWQKEKPVFPWKPADEYYWWNGSTHTHQNDLDNLWGKASKYNSPEGYKVYHFQWPGMYESQFTLLDPIWFHRFWLKNWEDYSCQFGTIHEDCLDLNTESKVVQDYLIDAYGEYIKMGVDGFRIDTVKHISRNTFNRRFNPAFHEIAKQSGKKGFYMAGEVCVRDHGVWNKGNPALSQPFYTWKERTTYSEDDLIAAKEAYDYETGRGTNSQPTSDNHLLLGNDYRKPDYTQHSGLDVIDFRMHWNFASAATAFNVKDGDKYTNDATWNMTYVESHDYSPKEVGNSLYARMDDPDVMAENWTLMFTWRGIPTIFYGNEILFKAGEIIDEGPNRALEESGRAYFGKHLEGSVKTVDFGEYSNATGEMANTLSHPLAQHLIRLNNIRRAIPALQKGQYSTEGVTGSIAFKKRFTDLAKGVDSFVLVTISGSSTFKDIPNGTYIDAITGDTKVVTTGILDITCTGKGNARVYVLNLPGNTAPGKIGNDGKYLK
jgi:glycosidase